MARVAIVTGGTRGIGEAISIALRDEGVTVAANYAGNEEKARAFSDRTGMCILFALPPRPCEDDAGPLAGPAGELEKREHQDGTRGTRHRRTARYRRGDQ